MEKKNIVVMDDGWDKQLQKDLRTAEKLSKKMAKADQKKTVKRSPAKKK